jgi:uncharacterized repeat protein (TIGR01451 family)
LVLAVFGSALGVFGQPLAAQTPEGTVITNTATVSFTDANTNTYASVQASVNVTVGFVAGIDVTAGSATATPASPSTDNDLAFVIDNDGNGTDQVSVGMSISDPAVVTNVRYIVGASTYASLAALNGALATTDIVAGASLTVTVRYDVPAGQGGNPSTVTFTATSVRDGTVSASDNTVVTPAFGGTITVTPDGGQGLELLPSNGIQYTASFSVTSGLTGTDDLDLIASTDNGNLTIVSVNGVAGSSTQLSFNAGQTQTVDVVYTVNDVAAGSTDNLNLLARSVADPTIDDTGFFDLTVVRPSISVTKQAWEDGQGAQVSGPVLPGDFIEYRISVTNTGTADASSISVSDALPAEVTFVSTSDDGGTPAWVISEAAGTVTATLATLGSGATRFFWIRVQIN